MTVRPFQGTAAQFAVWNTVWTGLLAGDTGQPQSIPHGSDLTLSIDGVFGGGACQWEGSNDGGVTWSILSNPQGADIIMPIAGMSAVEEQPTLVRPNMVGGDGTANVNARMIARIKGV